MPNESWVPILTVLVPVLVAVATGYFAWLSGRSKGKADAQTQINEGFKLLVNQLQEERILFSGDLLKLRIELRRAEKLCVSLERHVNSLQGLLEDNQIPYRPFSADDILSEDLPHRAS